MELFESENMKLNLQSEFACELLDVSKHNGWQFKSQFASDLDSFHNSLINSARKDDRGNGEADIVINESHNRDSSYLEDYHLSEQVK